MSDSHDTTEKPAPRDPADLHEAFVAAFNARDAGAVDRVYEENGVVVPAPGLPMAGQHRTSAIQYLLGMGLPIKASTRHVYTADDIALLVVDWSIRGTTEEGVEVDMSGTATDVARRGGDGPWRYVIDNPFGSA